VSTSGDFLPKSKKKTAIGKFLQGHSVKEEGVL